MENYKREFIDFMLEAGVLTFGDFMTKSGRKTPYFINTGNYRTGAQMARLGGFYADAIRDHIGEDVDVLFGPAYKGIPLVVTTSMALAKRGRDVGFCFDRKELKDHGEGGSLIGHKLSAGERVLIVEDVTTAGTSVRGTVPILRNAAAITLAGLVVSVDRQERGTTEKSALAQLREEMAMPTFAIVTIDEVVEHLRDRVIDDQRVLDDTQLGRIAAYRAEWGAKA